MAATVLATVSGMTWPFQIGQILDEVMQTPKLYPHKIVQLTPHEKTQIALRFLKLQKKENKKFSDDAELTHIKTQFKGQTLDLSGKFKITDHTFLKILFHHEESTCNRDFLGILLYEKQRSFFDENGKFIPKDKASKEFLEYLKIYEAVHGFLKILRQAQEYCALPDDEVFANRIENTSVSIESIILAADVFFAALENFADKTLNPRINQCGNKYSIMPEKKNYRPDLRIVDLVKIGRQQMRSIENNFKRLSLRAAIDTPGRRPKHLRAYSY